MPQTKNKSAAKPAAESSKSLPVGRMCWLGLRSPDVDASVRFFGEVLGWKAEDSPLGMKVCVGAGGAVGHYEAVAGPSSFLGYVVVADFEAAKGRVKAAGGALVGESRTIPSVGQMQDIVDGQGAALALFTPEQPEGATLAAGLGSLLWLELSSTDAKQAVTFLSSVVGYGVSTMEMPTGPYHVLEGKHEGVSAQLAGVMQAAGTGAGSAWIPYFNTDDVDAARARAIAQRATPLGEAFDVPGIGRMAQLVDPRGCHFAVMTAPTPAR